jgi:hypothetical protein
MASFYNQSTPGGGAAGGFYNAGNYGDQYQQTQQDTTGQSNHYQQQMNFGNMQQWQAPSASTSQNQNYNQTHQGGQQQSQAQSQTHNFWNPSTMAMAGLAAQAVSGGITSSQALDQVINIVPVPPNWKASSVIPGFDSTMIMLRAYFAVDNRYVQRKMKKVLFPFVAKQWRRLVRAFQACSYHHIGNWITALSHLFQSKLICSMSKDRKWSIMLYRIPMRMLLICTCPS